VARHLERNLLPFAGLLPLALGVPALALGPLLRLAMPAFLPALAAAQIFMFAGVLQGVLNLSSLALVASGRQRQIPLRAGACLLLSSTLCVASLQLGLGLRGVAAAALIGHACYAGSLVALACDAAGRGRAGTVARAILPTLGCAAAVALIEVVLPPQDATSLGLALAAYAALTLPQGVAGLRALRVSGVALSD
jgi:hypothetical protein